MAGGMYPKINADVAGEKAGIDVVVTVDPAHISAPTETWTHFAAAMASTTLGASKLVSGGLGYRLDSLGGTVYRTPLFTNA